MTRNFSAMSLVLCAGSLALGQNCTSGIGATMPIPDLGSTSLSYPGFVSGSVSAVKVCVWILHPRQGDLVVRLSHLGTTATLLNRPGTEDGQSAVGYTAANVGDQSAGLFAFIDSAAAPYAVPPVGNTPRPGIPNVHGEYKPTVDPLSVFVGMSIQGEWTLTVSDEAAGVTGTLQAFKLSFSNGTPCYGNCDGSTTPPVLNANDFMCFLNRFATHESWANCDGGTTAPLFTPNDFFCFLNAYAAGCVE